MLVEPLRLSAMLVGSSQCCALAEDVSRNKALRQEDVKDRQRKCEAEGEPALWQSGTREEAELTQKKENEETEEGNQELGFDPATRFCNDIWLIIWFSVTPSILALSCSCQTFPTTFQ